MGRFGNLVGQPVILSSDISVFLVKSTYGPLNPQRFRPFVLRRENLLRFLGYPCALACFIIRLTQLVLDHFRQVASLARNLQILDDTRSGLVQDVGWILDGTSPAVHFSLGFQ